MTNDLRRGEAAGVLPSILLSILRARKETSIHVVRLT